MIPKISLLMELAKGQIHQHDDKTQIAYPVLICSKELIALLEVCRAAKSYRNPASFDEIGDLEASLDAALTRIED